MKHDEIEKAAKAIRDAGGASPFAWETLPEAHREYRREQARAALAVFEEANTPTDDERDSPVEGMENGFEPWVGAFDPRTLGIPERPESDFDIATSRPLGAEKVQREPSDAAASAAQLAMRGRGLIVSREDMRAALRAAAEVDRD